MSKQDNFTEFDRQVETLLKKGYPKAANLSETEFLKIITPLKANLKNLELSKVDMAKGTLAFVIVIKSDLVPTEKMMGLVQKEGKEGLTVLRPLTPLDFKVVEQVKLPKNTAYLLLNIDRGKESLNVRPEDALKTITKANRTPLTIDEGIAIVTQFPEFLIKNNCFSLLASRTGKDQRVPAIWINAKKHPNLGWCWDRNPHTWLGSAHASKRVA